MNTKELYDHITAHMTAEQALMKLLEGHVLTYEQLKFKEGEEIHPTMVIVMATLDMGWNLAISNGDDDEELQGMIVGTQKYIDEMLGNDDCDKPNGWENKN